ncbi:FAD-dependent monooxygenase [Amycolatopsis pithecellobii]|uniref:Oxidoreductase n=1 Tax=Amycolatopsis pithecellobii TaxID=664692 RepID=A0A6N7YW15_9PSEU|nr:FAD-dependent monooxygenase [Amycolatopsis pithecellobii]MTD53063.1 oxidoreductase [Amycolatopsis pithecellobii]
MRRRIAVVGGGPGGAFVARLLRMAGRDDEVVLYEEHPPLATFGFGVGLSISTQQSLSASDPETFELIARQAQRGHGVRLHAERGSAWMAGNDQTAIARAELLRILYHQAEHAGVRMEIGARHSAFEIDADIVVAADGAGSATRSARADAFGAQVSLGRQRYIWCGADFALPDAVFAAVHTEHGVFTTHSYPFRNDRSTFLVETDPHTWRAAGFEHTSEGLQPGESDTTTLAYLEKIFAPHLAGGALLGNHSRWTQFRTVRCARWYDGNIVLLGDAAHTAHYSIGSGTKLAMEDAIALSGALARHDDLSTAFATYQQVRAPRVARLQALADRSQFWWESYVSRLDMPPERLLLSFITRAGNVSLDAFQEREPKLAELALRQFAGDAPPREPDSLTDWVMSRPLRNGAFALRSRDAARSGLELLRESCDLRDPRDEAADLFISGRRAAVDRARADGVELDGPPTRVALLERLDVAERLRNEAGLLTSVRAPAEFSADLAAGIAAGRIDLASITESRRFS